MSAENIEAVIEAFERLYDIVACCLGYESEYADLVEEILRRLDNELQ